SWASTNDAMRPWRASSPLQTAARNAERSAGGFANVAWKISSGFMVHSTPISAKSAEKAPRNPANSPRPELFAPHRGLQPGPRVGPVAVGGAGGNAQHVGGLIVG